MRLILPLMLISFTAHAAAPVCVVEKEAPFKGVTVRLARAEGSSDTAKFAVFKAPLAVNTDGAPTSYHPDDYRGKTKAINNIENGISITSNDGKALDTKQREAVFDQWRKSPDWKEPKGYSITWQNVIVANNKRPCIFTKENAGYFGSMTRLNNGLAKEQAGECMVRDQLDLRVISAIALRGGEANPLSTYGARVGDLVAVLNPGNGVVAPAIIGDIGNDERIGEGSVALNMALLKSTAQPTNYNEAKKLDTGAKAMTVVVLPGTLLYQRQRPYTAANIAQRVDQWSKEQGYGNIQQLVEVAAACGTKK